MCEVKICPASVAVPSKREQDVLLNQNRLFSVTESVQRPSSALHTNTSVIICHDRNDASNHAACRGEVYCQSSFSFKMPDKL